MEVLSETLKNPEKMSWNDHHDLLYIVHDQKAPEVLDNFFEKMKVKRNCQEMTPDDMTISAFIYKALKIVLETRSAIRDWIYPKAAIIIPMLRVLLNKSKKLDTSGPSSEALSMMKSELIEHLQNASNSCQNNDILKTATFLDSRFRDRFFLKSHKKFMIIKYQKFAEEYYNTILDVIKKEEEDSTEATAPEEQLEKEIAEYLREAPNPQTNPIEFWIKNNVNLPILKALSAQFLAIPACEEMKAKKVYEFGDRIYPEIHMNSIKEKFGYCAANMEIEKFANNCLNLK
ncbi:hypothetical protein B9Z55_018122 [Caenorhabditis nigoni]|uniref:HAT C-terminal dimerisation domain-containing protein n=1 Tax=Caenorhabditis nigoni TaxID=1611254 RepID=A0A2G5TCX6_9PELO|nr:hypothetical protein B9Z55_018122 [Caenorhabditis nigoni]